jgi:nitroreductase
MDFFKAVETRHSIRAFTPELIEEAKLKKILDAVNSAPSAGNLQAYEIILVKDFTQKKKLAEACMSQGSQGSVSSASAVLVFCSNPEKASKYGERGKDLYSIQDATIACTYAQLACAAQGIGSCWIGAFDEKAVGEVINAPFGMKVVAILPMGYPAKAPNPTSRRKLDDLVKEEKF